VQAQHDSVYKTQRRTGQGKISEEKMLAKTEWEADKCSNHHGYRLKGKVGCKRSIPMNSAKPVAARFY